MENIESQETSAQLEELKRQYNHLQNRFSSPKYKKISANTYVSREKHSSQYINVHIKVIIPTPIHKMQHEKISDITFDSVTLFHAATSH